MTDRPIKVQSTLSFQPYIPFLRYDSFRNFDRKRVKINDFPPYKFVDPATKRYFVDSDSSVFICTLTVVHSGGLGCCVLSAIGGKGL